MSYPHNIIEEVRMNNDIVDVIGESVQLKASSGNFVGLCPFHHEKTPSFHVNVRGQFFHCFGCGESGDVISYIMKSRNFAFTDAIKYLADRVHYVLPEESHSADYRKSAELRQTLYEMNKKAARHFYENLQGPDGFLARKYLDERRISGKARGIYGLGYSSYKSGDLTAFLEKEGYSKEMMIAGGLVSEGKNGRLYDKFFNRLMFPIIDIHDRIIGFGGRILEEGNPKYLNSPETPVFNKSSNLYSLNLAIRERTRELILVEGYMDVIALYQAGFRNVAAALGTSFNNNHTRLLKKYADSVILLFDSDEAGEKAVLRALPVLRESGIEAKVLQVRNAKDPDEYIKRFGRESFAELLKTAVPHIEFQMELKRRSSSLSNIEEKVSYANEAAKIISSIDNEIERDAYVRKLADETGISVDSIKTEVNKKQALADIPQRKTSFEKRPSGEKSGLISAKKGIINIISYHPYVYDEIKNVFKPEYLCDAFLEKLCTEVESCVRSGRPVYPAEIINYFENSGERDSVMDILRERKEPESKTELEKSLNDYIRTILSAYYSDKIKSETDITKIKELMDIKRKCADTVIKLK